MLLESVQMAAGPILYWQYTGQITGCPTQMRSKLDGGTDLSCRHLHGRTGRLSVHFTHPSIHLITLGMPLQYNETGVFATISFTFTFTCQLLPTPLPVYLRPRRQDFVYKKSITHSGS
jgi:hypothetical protein